MKMPKTIIAEGKTTNEAIANGLKELKVSKDKVEIKTLANEEKRSFFSILAPRVVKVQLTLKEEVEEEKSDYIKKENKKIDDKEAKRATNNINQFLKDFSKNLNITYNITCDSSFINVQIAGPECRNLIGYRGETLNALQVIINSIGSKGCESKVRVILNIGDYKEKREKVLEGLAERLAGNVLRTGKSVTLEPMMAYERRIIHNKLQSRKGIRTYSVGEEPYRKVVIAKNKF